MLHVWVCACGSPTLIYVVKNTPDPAYDEFGFYKQRPLQQTIFRRKKNPIHINVKKSSAKRSTIC